MPPIRKFSAPLGAVLACALALAAAAQPLDGTFALQGGMAKTAGYLSATQAGANPVARDLDFWLTPLHSSVPIQAYNVDMTQLLHGIIISDDFKTFIHAHPQARPDGHFALQQMLPAQGLYHLYIDGQPTGIGQQVFRFDFTAGASGSPSARDLSERDRMAQVDGYTVTLSTLTLKAGADSTLAVHVLKDGKPASDLHPYLAALAHAVFIDADDLSYLHAHPMPLQAAPAGSMHGMKMDDDDDSTAMQPLAPGSISAPDMSLQVRVIEPGTYKLWFQFNGGTTLHVAQFILTAT
jgi:hypothetical protein